MTLSPSLVNLSLSSYVTPSLSCVALSQSHVTLSLSLVVLSLSYVTLSLSTVLLSLSAMWPSVFLLCDPQSHGINKLIKNFSSER